MCSQNTVLDRVLVSDRSGGLEVPGTDLPTIEDAIWRLSGDDLMQVTRDAVKSMYGANAVIGLLAAELDRRHLPEIDEHLSTKQWLQHHTRMTAIEAAGTVKTGRAMAHMPTIAARAVEGEIPSRSLQLLARARNKHPEEFVEHESVLSDVATYLDVKDMACALNHWEQQIDYPGALTEAEHVATRRSLFLAQTIDGIGDLRGTLTPEQFHTVRTAVNAHSDPGNIDPNDGRTPAQRRADSLVDIHRFWLDHNADVVTSGGEKPHVTVTLDYRQLTGELARLPEMNGIPVTPETVRQLTCDAAIIPVVLGSSGEPLDIGRKTRTIPSALRRAVEIRDTGCTWPGCGAPVSWCDVHHNQHWADGGGTSLANCRLLCRKHHTTTHRSGDDEEPRRRLRRIRPRGTRSPPIA